MIEFTLRNSGGKKVYVRKEAVVSVKETSTTKDGVTTSYCSVVFVAGTPIEVDGDAATVSAALA